MGLYKQTDRRSLQEKANTPSTDIPGEEERQRELRGRKGEELGKSYLDARWKGDERVSKKEENW